MHSESPGWLNKALFNASYGLHSLDPSCQTMSLALCKAHNQKHLLLVELKQLVIRRTTEGQLLPHYL